MKELEEKLAYEKARNDHMESFLQAKFPNEFEIFSVRKARVELETATSAALTPVPTWPFLLPTNPGAGDTNTLGTTRSMASLPTQASTDPAQSAIAAQLQKLTELLEAKQTAQIVTEDANKSSTSG